MKNIAYLRVSKNSQDVKNQVPGLNDHFLFVATLSSANNSKLVSILASISCFSLLISQSLFFFL